MQQQLHGFVQLWIAVGSIIFFSHFDHHVRRQAGPVDLAFLRRQPARDGDAHRASIIEVYFDADGDPAALVLLPIVAPE